MNLFSRTYTVVYPLRLKTSDTKLAFYDYLSDQMRGNDLPGQWIRIEPGTKFHLISMTETPDQATILLEITTGKATATVGAVLRWAGWQDLMACSREQGSDISPVKAIKETTMEAKT